MNTVGAVIVLTLASSPLWGQGVSLPQRRAAGAPASPRCVFDLNQLQSSKRDAVSIITLAYHESAPPKPQRTGAPREIEGATEVPSGALHGDVSPQLCASLQSGAVSSDEVTAILGGMQQEHANHSYTKRKRVHKLGISYTYEYALHTGGLRLKRKPGEGYCADVDWRYMVRNVSQQNFTVFSTTGEVGLCFSPGFGLFTVPGLSSVMPFPVPGLCFDDAQFTKLDLRNVNDEFEDGLVDLINVAFDKMKKKDAKLCIIGAAMAPWFMPVVVRPKDMVAYCTSTRDCQVDQQKFAALIQSVTGTKQED
jgi:hypothetical protein